MCGIAGSVNHTLNIPLLTNNLYHRGPDEQTTYRDANLILHHHRLSILDITGGKQPMHYQHLTIIFNGEIYNHRELRNLHDLRCTTNSDTETLLHLYDKLGPEFLAGLDGMFALVIYDKNKNELFFARDRAGKKPFYYYSDQNSFVFCSELGALKNQLSLSINEQSIQEYLCLGYLYKESTPYENVYELPPGSYGIVSLRQPGVVDVKKWWNISDYYKNTTNDNFEDALAKTDSILHEAIKNRVESSDLEVGSFLSGGIDSGLVTAIAKQYNSTLKTFTVSFEGEYDEAPLAKLVAEQYRTKHHEIKISFSDLADDVEKILANYGEPHFDDSAIPSYYVSREARKYLTVILNGDGGDELFGGYRRYVPFSKIDFFSPGRLRRNLFYTGFSLVPDTRSKMSKLNYLKRLLFLGSASSPLETYLRSTTDIFEGSYNKFLFDVNRTVPKLSETFQKVMESGLTGLQKIMLLDFENIFPSVLLVKMDIATMANSLEGRSPMLCKGLLEYIPTLPDKLKIHGTTTKYLLRQLAKKYLPEQLINQPKRGFEVPLQQWLNNQLKAPVSDYLLSPGAYYKNYVHQKFVSSLLDQKENVSPEKRAKILWLLFTLEVWHKKVYQSK
jgi:asparagine synthase (glutamine-hydrolysing)